MKLKIHSSKNTYSNIFLILYGFYSFFSILDASLLPLSHFMTIVKWFTIISLMLFFVLTNLSNKIPIWKIFLSFFLTIFFTISASITDRLYLIIYAAFILNAQYSNLYNIIKTSLISALSSLFLIQVFCKIGIIHDYIFIYGARIAHCYGFSYYSTVPFILYYCLLMYLYLKRNRIKVFELVIILIINQYIFLKTTLRLTFYLSFITLGLSFLLQNIKKINLSNKIIVLFSELAFPFGTVITWFCMKNYDSSKYYWKLINKIFSSRLKLMNEGYYKYPIKIMGNYVEMRGASVIRETTNYFYIDSGFAYSLLGYGLMFTIILIFLYSALFKYSCVVNDRALFVWLFSVLIFTMINNTWVSLNYNPILMFSFKAIASLREKGRNST